MPPAKTESYKDIATRYNAAWNAHDVAAIMAFHVEDTSYQRHGSSKVYKGKDAVAEQFGKDISGLPGISSSRWRSMAATITSSRNRSSPR